MKRVLVAGGAGFLGSHLCERLLREGETVFCVDNFYTGDRRNIEHLISNPRFQVIEHDVTEPLDIGVDAIFNLACPASPVHYQREPIKTTRTSVLGSLNLLELARRNNAKILLASTSEVYGDPLVHPQTEDYWGNVNPIGVRSCYDEGKRCAETLFFDYFRESGTRIKVVRIFNTYGPRMQPDDGRVVSNFIVQALQGEDLTLYGDGLQTRSFCYVDDMIDALCRMMNSPDYVTGPVNLGNPFEFTIMELAEKVIKMTGAAVSFERREAAEDDPRKRKPDISKALELLNWRPLVELDHGLRNTIEYFRGIAVPLAGREAAVAEVR